MVIEKVVEEATTFSNEVSSVTQQMQAHLERCIDQRDFVTCHLILKFQKQLQDAQTEFLESVIDILESEVKQNDNNDDDDKFGTLEGLFG